MGVGGLQCQWRSCLCTPQIGNFLVKCFLKETSFFSSLSKSSTRKWPCSESWSFLLGTSRSAAPHSGRKCTRQEPEAVKWPVRLTKNLQPSQGRRLLALGGYSHGMCAYWQIFWWPRPHRWMVQIWDFNQSSWDQDSLNKLWAKATSRVV